MQILDFYICDTLGFLQVMNLIKTLLNILRFVIPIIVILMLIMDLTKNVINPNEKEGMKKIVTRVSAAVIVFLVPTIINLIVYFINMIFEDSMDTDYTNSTCYTNANSECIKNIEDYLNCDGVVSEDDRKKCLTYRQCNNYKLSSNCSLTTELNDDCNKYNTDSNYAKFRK